MRVLITRPEADAPPLAARLRRAGHEAVCEPMLVIAPRNAPRLDLEGVQAVLFTSANGARALAHATDRRDLPVLAVGEATAAAAREADFDRVESAGGDAADLAGLARARLDPGAGALLHAAGAQVKGTLNEPLEAAGFEVRRAVLYDARAAQALSSATARTLRQGRIDAVLFFSPRSARTFVSLLREAGLDAACRNAIAVCLSAAVADEAAAIPWRETRIADRPDQDALLALICEGGPRP